MSRYLSLALNEDELKLKQSLSELERSSGHANQDIRLSSEMMQGLTAKLKELGLDPKDTTGEELYHALNHKLANDDAKLLKKLRTIAAHEVNAEANTTDGIAAVLKQLAGSKNCFVLKSSALKRLLKSIPPKKAMKGLNYRSVDSMLKHEPLALVVLAINNFESTRFIETFYTKYKGFKATDFESRPLSILLPKGAKWQSILAEIKQKTGQQLISCYELGSLIILPMENSQRPGLLSASLVLILNELSKLFTTTTYLKLKQVDMDFSKTLFEVAEHEPMVSATLLNRPIPWHLVQSVLDSLNTDIDLPHVSSEDLSFTKLMDKLGDIVDDFKFWQSTEFLGLIGSAETTSMNILDVAINLCSGLPFEKRQTEQFKKSLWQEITRRYISPEIVTASLRQPSLEMELAEI